ncbi:4'-phosphopantetheinyl transferase family protein [Arthrobacter flavus]|uniref:4'-phosphopantetheinyl transferase family protein n=1 Tax=Arthrobacter flavus TaxID=95172 RepID=A0ABW4Q6G8_9MICC
MPVHYIAVTASGVARTLEPLGGLDRFLPGPVRAAAARLQYEQDRLTYRAAHAVFRLMAAQLLGATPAEAAALPVTRSCRACGSGLHGKPAIAGVELSLSRSAGSLLVASAPAGHPIGADIEHIPDAVFDGFDAYALSIPEREQLRSDDVDARLRLWVAKEAVLKATGHGLSIEPSTFSIAGNSCTGLAAAEHLKLAWVGPPAGYVAAIAAPAALEMAQMTMARLV